MEEMEGWLLIAPGASAANSGRAVSFCYYHPAPTR